MVDELVGEVSDILDNEVESGVCHARGNGEGVPLETRERREVQEQVLPRRKEETRGLGQLEVDVRAIASEVEAEEVSAEGILLAATAEELVGDEQGKEGDEDGGGREAGVEPGVEAMKEEGDEEDRVEDKVGVGEDLPSAATHARQTESRDEQHREQRNQTSQPWQSGEDDLQIGDGEGVGGPVLAEHVGVEAVDVVLGGDSCD